MRILQDNLPPRVTFYDLAIGDTFVRADVNNPREVYIKTDGIRRGVGARFGALREFNESDFVYEVVCDLHVIAPECVKVAT